MPSESDSDDDPSDATTASYNGSASDQSDGSEGNVPVTGVRQVRKRDRGLDQDVERRSRQIQRFVGRTVALPSWCCGRAWSKERYGSKAAANRARLHGTLENCNQSGQYKCRFWHDDQYTLLLEMWQVMKYVVPAGQEDRCRDTPFVNPDSA